MTRLARFLLMLAASVALCSAGVRAQSGGASQQPPDRVAKPAAQAEAKDIQAKSPDAPKAPELTADQKAFNAIAEEKDAQKRAPLYEKFIADYPKSAAVSMARSEIQRATLASLKTSAAKYQEYVKTEIETAKKGDSPTRLPSAYGRFASELLGAGIMLAEAEEFARQAVSLLDEQKYIDYQKKSEQTMLDDFNKRAANPTPAAAPSAPASGGISFRMVNGAPTIVPLAPRPSSGPPRTPTAPRLSTDESLRASFRSMRASNLATLGQVLMKRDKTAEGEKVLKQAYDLKPSNATVGTIARLLADSAKKAGDAKAQLEYLTALALTGSITADEQKELEAAYRGAHNGSLDGLEDALDAKYVRENPRFTVTPANRKVSPGQRVVLAEDFSGAG